MTTSALEALKPGLTALNDFSSILTHAIESIDDNVSKLRGSQDDTFSKLLSLITKVNSHDERIRDLEAEFSGQREVVERAMKIAASLEKNVSHQLDDATRSLHKELVIQRTITKMDISSLRGKLSQSMSEMLNSVISPTKTYNPDSMPAYNPNYTTAESIQFLVQKVQKLDEAMGLQHTVNQHLSHAIGNEEVIQKVYDSLFEEITSLNNELAQSKDENQSLQNSLKEMKNAQARQERVIADILEALASKERLRELRSEIKRGGDRLHHDNEDTNLEADGGDEVGVGEFLRKRSPTQRTRRSTERRGRRTYAIKLHNIDEQDREENRDDLNEENKGENDPSNTSELAGGVNDRPARRTQITARLSTLVRREAPQKKPKFKPPLSEINDEVAEDQELDSDEAEDEEVPEMTPASTSQPRVKDSSSKRNTQVSKTSSQRPSKVVQKVKQIRQQRVEAEQESDEEEEEDEEEDGLEPDEGEQREREAKKKSKKSRQASTTTTTAPSTSRRSRVPSPKSRVDTRKDTLKAANFYRGDGNEASHDSNDDDGEYRPLRRTGDTSLKAKTSHSTEGEKEAQDVNKGDIENMTSGEGVEEGSGKEEVEQRREGEAGEEEQDDGNSRMTGEESSLFNDGSESLFAEDSSIGRHLIDVLEANNVETANVINTLRDEYNDRLDTVETTLATFKRIAFVIDDLKIGFEAVRKRVDAVTTGETFEEKMNAALLGKIDKLKEQWSRVYSELVFALENVNQGELDREVSPDAMGNTPPSFFQRARELSYAIEDGLDDFNPRDTIELTMEKLFPSLDKIHAMAEQLIEDDSQARLSTSLDYCFDDLLCSDLTPSLRGLMVEAANSSIPVLDEGVAKIRMSRQVKHLLTEIEKKADKGAVMDNDTETRRLIQQKVDSSDFMAVTSKLASSTEVQRLQHLMNEGHYSGSTNNAHNALAKDLDLSNLKPLTEQPEFQQLVDRLNALASKQYELETKSEKLVPKEEVHEALKAIVAEIKNLRKNCVLLPVFREGLKSKADIAEVEKLVKTITEVVGDYNFSADFASSAAAIHAKCLICDKPVSSQRARTANANNRPNNGGNAVMMSRSLSQAGYDKADDELQQQKKQSMQSSSIIKRINSPNPAVSKSAKAKVLSEMTIIRSTIEPLPEINDSFIESPRPQSSNAAGNNVSEIQYKQRIRNSAGGGMGPNYKMDTR
eukprot:gene11549-12596_t